MQEGMNICIAYMACRLISGKQPVSLYDYAQARQVKINGLPDAEGLRAFERNLGWYMPGYASGCVYEHAFSNGQAVELFIKEDTFVVHISGSAAYYIGHVRNDTIYLFDHRESTHLYYRIEECAIEEGKPV